MRSRRSFGVAVVVAWLSGVSFSFGQFWEVDNRLLEGSKQQYADFGRSLAIGDFDGDGVEDLVAGEPLWNSATMADLGRWRTYHGSADRTLTPWGVHDVAGNSGQQAGKALAAGDFDGDGRDEVAVGMPGKDIDDGGVLVIKAGAVTIAHNDPRGWYYQQSLSQHDAVSSDGVEDHDGFGSVLAVGNFNGDLYEDLVVGVPSEGLGTIIDAGAVHVFYGSAIGLKTVNVQTFSAGVLDVWGTPGPRDHFGQALAAGDFDDDGYDDLAIGAPQRDVGGEDEAGQVHILYGSAIGLSVSGQQLFSSGDFPGGATVAFADFGQSLAVGNFDQGGITCLLFDCFDDLAIGIPSQDFFSLVDVGRVTVAYGSASGIQTAGATQIDQLSNGDSPEVADIFGWALAAGLVDRRPESQTGSYHDLVVGAPWENIDPGLGNVGLVQLFFGSAAGLDQGQQEQLIPLKAGFQAAPAVTNINWGEILAVGDLDGDGWGDLVVGLPRKEVAGFESAGVVQVLYGGLFADGFESGNVGTWSGTSN